MARTPTDEELLKLRWLLEQLQKSEIYCRPYFDRAKRHYKLYRFSTAVSDSDWPYVNRVRSRDILAFVEDTTAMLVQTLFATTPFISIIPRETGNSVIKEMGIDLIQVGKQIERLLDYQLSHEDTDFFEEIIDYLKGGAIQGNSYLGVYPQWQGDEYVLPLLKATGFWDVMPIPGSTRISKARGVFVREFCTLVDLKESEKFGVYQNVGDVKDNSADTDKWHKMLLEEVGITGYSDTNDVEVIHYFSGGHVITFANRRVFLRDSTVAKPDGTLVQPYPYANPIVQYKNVPIPNEFFGMGIPEILEVLQEDKNLIRSARRDNIDLCINKILMTKEGADVNYDLLKFFPGAIWPDTMDKIKPFEVNDVTQSSYAEEKQIQADMENALSLFGYARGQTPAHCVDDETEILTDEGWKFFKDLNKTEKVLTANLKTGKYEWKKPSGYIDQDYDGWMIECKNHNINFKITPNHKMIVMNQKGEKRLSEFSEIRAGDRIPRTYEWDSTLTLDQDFYCPPFRTFPVIKLQDIMAFLGIFIAEGHARGDSKSGYTIEIAQESETNKNKIRNLLNRLPFDYKERGNGFYIYHKEFCLWLMKEIGKKEGKHIPKEFKEMPSCLLSILWDWLCLGDGNISKTKLRGKIYEKQHYTTYSKALADDIQEIILKMGKNCTVHYRDGRTTYDKKQDKTYECKPQYEIVLLNSKTVNGFNSKTHKYEMAWYTGKVYCIEENENKTMVTRRHGQTLVTGRSEQPTTVMKLQQASMNRQDINIKLVEFTVLQEIARKIVMLNRQYMKQETYEAILGEPDAGFYKMPIEYINRCYVKKPVGSSITHIKEVRQQQIEFALKTLLGIPPQIMQGNIRPFTIDYLEVLENALDVADVKTINRILIEQPKQDPLAQMFGGMGGGQPGQQGGGGLMQMLSDPNILKGLAGIVPGLMGGK